MVLLVLVLAGVGVTMTRSLCDRSRRHCFFPPGLGIMDYVRVVFLFFGLILLLLCRVFIVLFFSEVILLLQV